MQRRAGGKEGLGVQTRPAVEVTRRIQRLQGETFGAKFKVDGDIHDGGEQCKVKRVVCRENNKEFVVKVQKKSRIRGANEALFRRMTERMMNMPDDVNVVRIEACFEDAEYFYTLMDSCKGGDLFDFLRMLTSDDMQPAELNRELQIVMRELMLSLRHLHSQGLVHKDVKLENLVFKDKGGIRVQSPKTKGAGRGISPGSPKSPKTLKLIDFDFTQEWEPNSPKSKAVLGTDGYIAPEAYLGDVNPKSDVFSAGVVLYLLVSGRFPYIDEIFDDEPGQNLTSHPKMREIYDKMRKFKVQWKSPVWKQLPECHAFCQRCMEFDFEKRYDADQALHDPWLSNVTTTADEPQPDA